MAFLSHKDYAEYVDRTSPQKEGGRRKNKDGPWDFVNPVFEEDFPVLDIIPSDDLVEDYMDKERRRREEGEEEERRRGGRGREKEARGERRRTEEQPEEARRTRWVDLHEKRTRFGDEREDQRKKTAFRLREKDLTQEEEAEDEEVVVVMSLEEDDYEEDDFYGSRVAAWSPERRRGAESSSSGGSEAPDARPGWQRFQGRDRPNFGVRRQFPSGRAEARRAGP